MKDLVIGLHMAARDGKGAVQQIAAAEAAGIDVAWMTCGGVAPDPLTVFSAAALRTERIGFGTCIIPTFPRRPLALAQAANVVDSLAPGRLRLGVAQMGFYQRLPFYRAMWLEANFEDAAGAEFTRRMFDALVVHGDEQLMQNDRAARDRTIGLLGELARSA